MGKGSVAGLYRWPVKSFAGERMNTVTVGGDGVPGDRTYAVMDVESDAPLSARQAPRLLQWSATYDRRDPVTQPPAVRAPGGSHHEWGDGRLPGMLEDSLERRVVLAEAPGRHHDRPGTLLVTTEVSRRAVEAALDLVLDIRRFRPNIHLNLDAAPYAEEGWEGWEIRLAGGVVLDLLEPCDRCAVTTYEPSDPGERQPEVLRELQLRRDALFGIRAAVKRPGRVVEGEAAEVRPA